MSETLGPSETTANVSAASSGDAQEDKRHHILVVDDNVDIVKVICRILTAQGYRTSTANDGAEGLEKARALQPDVVLLDWMMPGLDGLEVCRALKQDPETRGIMIILVTGRGSVANRVEGFDAGADDFIPKPFHHPELLARIRSALRIKELTDSLEERNRQLLRSQAELVRQEKMATIGLLASGIAHEFNNIMAGISGYAQLARSNPQLVPQLIEVTLSQALRAHELTRSLSTYHRPQDGPASTDVERALENTLCLVRKRVEEKGIDLRVDVSPDTPRAAIRTGQLQEVVLNLVINAVHATPARGTIRITAKAAAEGGVAIDVSDTGAGIAPENIDRIFDPFFTTKGALGGGREHGTGLGLSVVYNLLQSRGGSISVESEVGRGTTFHVLLPRGEDISDQAEALESLLAPHGSESAGSPARRRQRVLVIDDEPLIRSMIGELLGDHDVVLCATGEEAIRAYENERFDWVVLDLCLESSLPGTEVMSRILALDPDARIVVASGKLQSEIDPSVFKLAHGHLLKPYKLEDLAELLGTEIRSLVP
ncbi:MAG TPA: response regulator [Planctomycetota bacterium]|nr:response regulator [Planctomycetota bacterium]